MINEIIQIYLYYKNDIINNIIKLNYEYELIFMLVNSGYYLSYLSVTKL